MYEWGFKLVVSLQLQLCGRLDSCQVFVPPPGGLSYGLNKCEGKPDRIQSVKGKTATGLFQFTADKNEQPIARLAHTSHSLCSSRRCTIRHIVASVGSHACSGLGNSYVCDTYCKASYSNYCFANGDLKQCRDFLRRRPFVPTSSNLAS